MNDDFETLIGLVSQYSPSGQERGAVEWLVARMKALGFDDAFIDEAGNAVGVMGKGTRQVVLLGHIDTVPGEISVRVEDGILYGRGSVDAKGPLASFVDAVAKVGAKDGWQFVVIGAIEEERNSEGARFVATQYKPDFAIIGEPNQWDRMALGYKGSAWANVTVKRGQAHTASGEETAAEAAVEVWLKIKAYVDSFNADKPKVFDKLLLTLRGMDSDSNDFEQWARLKVGVRLPVEVSPEDWYQILNETLRVSETLRVLIEPVGFAIPAWGCEKNTQLVRSFLSGIRSQGGEPRFVYKTGTADLNIVAPVWKCPAVVYGPGDSALDHTPDEHISLEDYSRAVQVLSSALSRLTE
ncbi:[LysW]-lysine hydrolase [Candidatus Villigracilis affinis]|uniref:[LysW]-lysine hydrolase n=1 Tax=Candidatus Villigracilis affinis TaxID=3140682 RepID=UPI002A1CC5DF|nr:[LysW]-lysine hydrolase [Anaerolineales bacterium]